MLFSATSVDILLLSETLSKEQGDEVQKAEMTPAGYVLESCASKEYKVPGEIKRSRDLRGGRWSWDLQICPEEIMSREVELG